MTKTKTIAFSGLAVLVAAVVIAKYMNDFSRLKRVEISGTPAPLGSIGKVVFTNRLASKVDFKISCYFKVRSGGAPLFSQSISLAPTASVEFDVNPELAGRELPPMIANKACEAIWRGPFGMERSAWWVNWQYGKPPHKVSFG